MEDVFVEVDSLLYLMPAANVLQVHSLIMTKQYAFVKIQIHFSIMIILTILDVKFVNNFHHLTQIKQPAFVIRAILLIQIPILV